MSPFEINRTGTSMVWFNAVGDTISEGIPSYDFFDMTEYERAKQELYRAERNVRKKSAEAIRARSTP